MQYILSEEEYNTLMQRAGDPEITKKEIDKAYTTGVEHGRRDATIEESSCRRELESAKSDVEFLKEELLSEKNTKQALKEQVRYFHNQAELFASLPWYKRIIFKFNF